MRSSIYIIHNHPKTDSREKKELKPDTQSNWLYSHTRSQYSHAGRIRSLIDDLRRSGQTRPLVKIICMAYIYILHTFTFQLLDKPWSQVSSLLLPGSCLQFFIAHRVQQSHCSSIVHRVLLTHALALSASQFVHKKKSQRIYTSKHSAGLELTKLTYTRLEDNLIRHRGDRYISCAG